MADLPDGPGAGCQWAWFAVMGALGLALPALAAAGWWWALCRGE